MADNDGDDDDDDDEQSGTNLVTANTHSFFVHSIKWLMVALFFSFVYTRGGELLSSFILVFFVELEV